ncbi:MAG TPA: hypothetical protein VM490_26875, partial [Armatimonadaceae bacterium]|nr:hypothetical protein [Armatimonadaceae bacterium]
IGVLVEMRSGAITYVSVRMKRPDDGTAAAAADGAASPPPAMERPTPEDSRLFLQHLFDRSVLFGRMDDDQGIFLLNPAIAVRCALTPPPPLPPGTGIWHMNLVGHT